MQRLKKGVWTKEEDRKLLSYIQRHGEGGWRLLPQKAGLMRCGKSCRLRWANYLRPGIRRGEFTPEEEQTIIRLHAVLGNRWATISRHLYRRTDNEIKNHWNTHLKNCVANHTNIIEEHPLAAKRASTEDNGENNSPISIEQVISGTTNSVASTYHSANTVDTDLTQSLQCSDDNNTISMDLILPNSSEGTCISSGGTITSSATIRTNISYSDQAYSRSSSSSSSSARVLNKIASKMGRLNIRHASLDCSIGCLADGVPSSSTAGFNLRSPATDSSATSKNIEGMFEDATLFQHADVFEVCEGQLMCLQSMKFQCPIEELYSQSTCSYNAIA